MDHCTSRRTLKTKTNLHSAHANEAIRRSFTSTGDIQPGWRAPFPVLSTAGKMVHWCDWYDFLIKLQKLWVKWWKQTDRAVMLDQLMNLVLSCSAGVKLSCVLQRITESQTQLIQLQLRVWGYVGTYSMCKWASDWKTLTAKTLIKFLLWTCWQKKKKKKWIACTVGISLELCFSPPDKCQPSV